MTTTACTLPTTERPLRLAEFDDLFRHAVVGVTRDGLATRLTLEGGADLRDRVADLTARESQCCSFFEFTLGGDDDELVLAIAVPAPREEILDALTERAIELSA